MLGELLEGLIDIVYPRVCIVCKNKLKNRSSVDNIICAECWGKIAKNLPPFCHCCGRHLEKSIRSTTSPSLEPSPAKSSNSGLIPRAAYSLPALKGGVWTPPNVSNFSKNICHPCLKQRLHFDRAFSPCAYTGVIKELIHEFKYKNKDYLGATLSRLAVEFIKEYDLPMGYLDYIVPVPLHKTKLREREFNQAEILSEYISREFKKDLLTDVLKRSRQTKTQTDLEINERMLNVKGSFLVAKPNDIRGKNLLLIDDVLTTGATSSEAAFALKNSGANIVFVLTLAN